MSLETKKKGENKENLEKQEFPKSLLLQEKAFAKIDAVLKLSEKLETTPQSEVKQIEELSGSKDELDKRTKPIDQEIKRTRSGFIDKIKKFSIYTAILTASLGDTNKETPKSGQKIKIPESEYLKKEKAYRDSLLTSKYSTILLNAVKEKNFKETLARLEERSEENPYLGLTAYTKLKPIKYVVGTTNESGSVWNEKTKQREPYKNTSINYKIPVYKAPVFNPETKYTPVKGFWKTINEKIENSEILDKWRWKTSEGTIPVRNLEYSQEKKSVIKENIRRVYEYFAGKPQFMKPNELASVSENKNDTPAKKVVSVKPKVETKKVLKPEDLLNNKKQEPETKPVVKKVTTPEKKTNKTESEVMYVEDKNDPRFKAYQDSSKLYNITKKLKDKYGFNEPNNKGYTVPFDKRKEMLNPVDDFISIVKETEKNTIKPKGFMFGDAAIPIYEKPKIEVRYRPKPKSDEVKITPIGPQKLPVEKINTKDALKNFKLKEVIKFPEKTMFTVRVMEMLYYLDKDSVDRLEKAKGIFFNVSEKGDRSEKSLVWRGNEKGLTLEQVAKELKITLPRPFNTNKQQFEME